MTNTRSAEKRVELVAELVAGRISVDALRVPLADVEQAWNTPAPAGRPVVLVP